MTSAHLDDQLGCCCRKSRKQLSPARRWQGEKSRPARKTSWHTLAMKPKTPAKNGVLPLFFRICFCFGLKGTQHHTLQLAPAMLWLGRCCLPQNSITFASPTPYVQPATRLSPSLLCTACPAALLISSALAAASRARECVHPTSTQPSEQLYQPSSLLIAWQQVHYTRHADDGSSSMASAQKGCVTRLQKEYKGLLRVSLRAPSRPCMVVVAACMVLLLRQSSVSSSSHTLLLPHVP